MEVSYPVILLISIQNIRTVGWKPANMPLFILSTSQSYLLRLTDSPCKSWKLVKPVSILLFSTVSSSFLSLISCDPLLLSLQSLIDSECSNGCKLEGAYRLQWKGGWYSIWLCFLGVLCLIWYYEELWWTYVIESQFPHTLLFFFFTFFGYWV